jgi:hypothetical protein
MFKHLFIFPLAVAALPSCAFNLSRPAEINKRHPLLYYGNRRRQIICIAI